VFLQSWWSTPENELRALIGRIREDCPETRLVYLDWFAPTHIPQPWLVETTDLYIKKHVLSDRRRYEEGFHDTNLVEYEAVWDGSLLPEKEQGISIETLKEKLFVGWNFATAPGLVRQLNKPTGDIADRSINVHCRIGADRPDKPWYKHMRRRSLAAAQSLDIGKCIATSESVPYKRFWRELCDSRLCFSPFGFGEVCWRDFEAIAAGAVLIKPDMSHIETYPNIYKAYETYIPVRWDFSDLGEQCQRYLNDIEACRELATKAQEVWQSYLNRGMDKHLDCLWSQLTKVDTSNGHQFD
jgi:hypothetical protein